MNDTSSKCANTQCGCPVQPADVFCPNCGQPVAAGGPQEHHLIRESAAVDSAVEPSVLAAMDRDRMPPVIADRRELRAEPKIELLHQTAPPGEAAAEPQPGDCRDLEVRYNNSCVFVLNMQSTFDFEIRPLADGITSLFVEVRQSGQLIARETPMVLPRRGVPICFGLNYTPRNTHAGKVSFTIVVGYRLGGAPKVYAAYRTHTLHSGKEDPRRVCESLVIEVKNNIQQGHAGDLKVDQNFNGLREALRQHNTIEIDREFLGLINARPFWTPLVLAECAADAVPGTGLVRGGIVRRQHLELSEADGTRIHLMTQGPVRIGRHRDCEVLARVVDQAGRELREESMVISQFHAQMDWDPAGCRLKDGGHYPDTGWRRSTAGVWVDGKRLPAGGEFRFAPGREHRVTLGEPAAAAGTRFELSARLWFAGELPEFSPTCRDAELTPATPVCLVLRRLHGPDCAYLLLRSCASLAWASSRCRHACVCLRQGTLCWSGGQSCEALAAGRSVQAGELHFQVTDRQTGH